MELISASARWEDWAGNNSKLNEDEFHDSGNGSSPEESLISRNVELQLQPISRCHIRSYHHVPEFDRVRTVKCSICGKIIRAQSFAMHCARRHNLDVLIDDDQIVSCLQEPLKNTSLDNVLSFTPSPAIFRDESLDNNICAPVEESQLPILPALSDREASNISSATEEQNFMSDLGTEKFEERLLPAPIEDESHPFFINNLSEDINRNSYLKPQLTPNTLEQLNILPAGANAFNDESDQETKIPSTENPFIHSNVPQQMQTELHTPMETTQPAPPQYAIHPSDLNHHHNIPSSEQFQPMVDMNPIPVSNHMPQKIEVPDDSEDFLPEDLRNIVIKKDFDCPEMSKLLESDLNFGTKFDKDSLLDLFAPEQPVDVKLEPTLVPQLPQPPPPQLQQPQPPPQLQPPPPPQRDPPVIKKAKQTKKSPRRRSQIFDPDRNCGVTFLKNGVETQCMRAITCKAHSLSSRKEVPGRSKPLLTLMQELTAEKHALKLEKERELAALNGTLQLIPQQPPIQPQTSNPMGMGVNMVNQLESGFIPVKQPMTPQAMQPPPSIFPIIETHSPIKMQEKVNCIPPPAVCNVANVPPPPQQQPTPAPLDPAPEVTFTESVCQQETKSDVEAQEQDLDQNMLCPLYEARKVPGSSILSFNRSARKLRNIFSTLLSTKPKVPTAKQIADPATQINNECHKVRPRNGHQIMGAFPNFMSQQRLVNGVTGPAFKSRIDKVPVSASMKQQQAHPMAFLNPDKNQAVMNPILNDQVVSSIPLPTSPVKEKVAPQNFSRPMQENLITQEAPHQNSVTHTQPVPCYQSSPMSGPIISNQTPVIQANPDVQVGPQIQSIQQNRKRKMQLPGGLQSQSAISPVAAKMAAISTPDQMSNSPVMQSPQPHHMVALPNQPHHTLPSPVDEMSPRTPVGSVLHQPMSHEAPSWPTQMQSPVGYPPTPSPQLPASPNKNPYAVHHQMSLQQQSPVPVSPVSGGVMVPRYGSPTQNNNVVTMKSNPQYRMPMPYKPQSNQAAVANAELIQSQGSPNQARRTTQMPGAISLSGAPEPMRNSSNENMLSSPKHSNINYINANSVSPGQQTNPPQIPAMSPQANPATPLAMPDSSVIVKNPNQQLSPSATGYPNPIPSQQQMGYGTVSPGQSNARMYAVGPQSAQHQQLIASQVSPQGQGYVQVNRMMRPGAQQRYVSPNGMKAVPLSGSHVISMGTARMASRFMYPNQIPNAAYQQPQMQLAGRGHAGGTKMYAVRGIPATGGQMMTHGMGSHYRAHPMGNHQGVVAAPMSVNARVMSPMGHAVYRGQAWQPAVGYQAMYRPQQSPQHIQHHPTQAAKPQQQVYVNNSYNGPATGYAYSGSPQTVQPPQYFQTKDPSSIQAVTSVAGGGGGVVQMSINSYSPSFPPSNMEPSPHHQSHQQFNYGNMQPPNPTDAILIE